MSLVAAEADLVKKVEERRSYIIRKLLEWGSKNSPAYPWRKNTTPYNILISELLLRKTRADKVSEVFPLFLQEFPTVQDLSKSSPEKVRDTIYVLGRLKRNREIMTIARTLAKRYSGNIPHSEKELFDAIGNQSRYTVNAIRCFAYGEKVPVFDVNVNRVLSRVFSADFGKQGHKNEKAWKLAEMLLPASRVKEYNWALLDLGRTICTTEPRCKICPLVGVCDFAKNVTTGE